MCGIRAGSQQVARTWFTLGLTNPTEEVLVTNIEVTLPEVSAQFLGNHHTTIPPHTHTTREKRSPSTLKGCPLWLRTHAMLEIKCTAAFQSLLPEIQPRKKNPGKGEEKVQGNWVACCRRPKGPSYSLSCLFPTLLTLCCLAEGRCVCRS